MDDLPARLRELYVQHGTNYVQEAAREIERLRAELAEKHAVPQEPDAVYRHAFDALVMYGYVDEDKAEQAIAIFRAAMKRK